MVREISDIFVITNKTDVFVKERGPLKRVVKSALCVGLGTTNCLQNSKTLQEVCDDKVCYLFSQNRIYIIL